MLLGFEKLMLRALSVLKASLLKKKKKKKGKGFCVAVKSVQAR